MIKPTTDYREQTYSSHEPYMHRPNEDKRVFIGMQELDRYRTNFRRSVLSNRRLYGEDVDCYLICNDESEVDQQILELDLLLRSRGESLNDLADQAGKHFQSSLIQPWSGDVADQLDTLFEEDERYFE
jgi:hypothetical protein